MEPQQECVVYLSGPRSEQHRDGSPRGRANISCVRLRLAVRTARERRCALFAPIKKSERLAHRRDLRKIARETGRRVSDAVSEHGVAHTLANAWSALRHAYARGYRRLIVVTSVWHCTRAEIAFRGLAEAMGTLMAYEVALEFVAAPFSHSRRVRRFERFVMAHAEQEWKQEAERERVAEYARAIAETPPGDGFFPHPDQLRPLVLHVERTYQSRAEQDVAV